MNKKQVDRSDVYLSPVRKRLGRLFLIMDIVFLALGIWFFAYNNMSGGLQQAMHYIWLIVMVLAAVAAVVGAVKSEEYDIFRGCIIETVLLVSGGVWLGAGRAVILIKNPNNAMKLFFGVGLGVLFVIMLLSHIDWIWYRPIMHFMTKDADTPMPEVADDPARAAAGQPAAATNTHYNLSSAATRSMRRQVRRQNHPQSAPVSSAENHEKQSSVEVLKQADHQQQPAKTANEAGEGADNATKVLPQHETAAAANAERLAKLQQARRQEYRKERSTAAQKQNRARKSAKPKTKQAAAKPQKAAAQQTAKSKKPAQPKQQPKQQAKVHHQAKPQVKQAAQPKQQKPAAAKQTASKQQSKKAKPQQTQSPQWAKPKKHNNKQGKQRKVRSQNNIFIRSKSRVYKHVDHE